MTVSSGSFEAKIVGNTVEFMDGGVPCGRARWDLTAGFRIYGYMGSEIPREVLQDIEAQFRKSVGW